ncbi:MAG: family 43 glycosylhydrolase [Lachnospiraceae bacterium]|nr:family 43 glycosylhydrolase [Lachnospiraceae bacterium]
MMPNPFLPLNEYIPDGEPHVFGDRVYLYGSHDAANSTRFCVNDYTVWSAPVNDLSGWTCHGVAYRKDQDPRSKEGKLVDFYAPDCTQGPDGKYYLYYFAAGPNTKPFGPMSVAVSDRPEGPFEYYGDICYPDGSPVLDFLTNDPAVLNDDGRIRLYYGWGLGRDFRTPVLKPLYRFVLSKLCNRSIRTVRDTKPSILSCACVELESDMRTVKTKPEAVLDSRTTAPKGSTFYEHPFYEAASIRKFDGMYYLIYSSGMNNELAYATSKYPDHGFVFRGVIVSNSDLGYEGNTTPKNNSGTIHGSIERINGRYYVFYHRCTNNTDFSRQACAEPIEIGPDGMFRQAGITTQGMDEKPLSGAGTYPAALCCHLITPKPVRPGVGKQQSLPRITQSGDTVYLADLTAGTAAFYRYFDLRRTKRIRVDHDGNAEIEVNGKKLSENGTAPISGGERETLCLRILSGKADIRSFTLEE